MAGARPARAAPALCLVGAAAFAVTFALTEQAPEETLALSGVRIWAHVPEFFLQGLFLFGGAALWPHAVRGGRAASTRVRYGVALLACAACSLFDQVHKAFVPGREFDARDLLFDALGYLLAMVVVLVLTALVRSIRRSSSRLGSYGRHGGLRLQSFLPSSRLIGYSG